MDPIQILESRIAYLESILPAETKENLKEANVIESIMSADTLINSAISGREKMTTTVSRAEEVEKFLDPNYVVENKQINMKEIYLNTVVNDLANSFELLQKIKDLEPALGAEYFGNIPNVSDKLKGLIATAKEQKERNDMIEESLVSSIQRYSEIQDEIHRKLKSMNDYLDRYEEAVETTNRNKANDPLPEKK